MSARTYTAAEMRDAFNRGRIVWGRARDEAAAVAEAHRLWPDPAPEPPAMTVREEPDPIDSTVRWRWTTANGAEVYTHKVGWRVPGTYWFQASSRMARIAVLFDLMTFPNRLPDGRPCTLTGEAKP